jgi:hypothetical protein
LLDFLFPADPLYSRRVDEQFAAQRDALQGAGFSTSVLPPSALETTTRVAGVPANAVVVYRGWMVDEREYRNVDASVRETDAALYTTPEAYLLAHHLPNWYPIIRDLTPETVVFPADVDLESELRRLGWSAFFIKDYVKSLKTGAGSFITTPGEAGRVVEDMLRFRGVIEGGICVRRVEDYRPDSEIRYFVVGHRPYAPGAVEVPGIVSEVARRFHHPFFSVDVAVTKSGEDRVVEVGDGQVSDLVGWSVDDFVRMWQQTA